MPVLAPLGQRDLLVLVTHVGVQSWLEQLFTIITLNLHMMRVLQNERMSDKPAITNVEKLTQ
jgi:hypothetical protein